ncbi:MAG: thioesterase family protein [Acidimicrobiales bacterium]
MSGEAMTVDDYVADTLRHLPARRVADGFVGDAPDWFGPTLFGGFVLGQATSAIVATAPAGFVLHSLHGYFLSAMRSGVEATYATTVLRDGRSFAHRSLLGTQEGRPFFTLTASFTAPDRASDFEYGRALDPGVPRPAAGEVEIERGRGPWDVAWLGPTPADASGFRASSERRWVRFGRPLPDDAGLHVALLAYATDMTGSGARPLLMDLDGIEGIVSLDHAVWFHRPVRVDDWLFYDITATINTGGRGHLRGQLFGADGAHVASVAQETLVWDPRR